MGDPPERFASFYNGLFRLWLADLRAGRCRSIKLFDDVLGALAFGISGACGMGGRCHPQLVVEADGTVYPILRKLKADGLLTTYLQEESGGPPRKYYKLTELGRETYQNDRAEYLNFAQSVRTLLEDENNDKA